MLYRYQIFIIHQFKIDKNIQCLDLMQLYTGIEYISKDDRHFLENKLTFGKRSKYPS